MSSLYIFWVESIYLSNYLRVTDLDIKEMFLINLFL